MRFKLFIKFHERQNGSFQGREHYEDQITGRRRKHGFKKIV
jgi:hypothetical protein